MKIVGISAYYHDSAVALLNHGEIVAAAQEERFTRKKHDAGFPDHALTYCLEEANSSLADVDYVVFYDKPLLKFERLLETYLAYAPGGLLSFIKAMPVWLKEKLFLKTLLRDALGRHMNGEADRLPGLLFTAHHQSHAASAFFPSPFEEAAVLCIDGVGEWATTSTWVASGNELTPQWQIDFPHSLGLLYSAFTYYTGFKVNSGEYKLMGLAPYGEPRYVHDIMDNLVDVKDDGTFRLNMSYFDYPSGLRMTNERFNALFGGPPRAPESVLEQKHMDIARSIQEVTEDIVLRIGRAIREETGQPFLCMAGGVALNCVANGRLLQEGVFDDIWIQPAAGDAGGALGAAYSVWHEYLGNPRSRSVCSGTSGDSMRGCYLGPRFDESGIEEILTGLGASFQKLQENELPGVVSDLLSTGSVVGWFQGRMEFGPRALGARSILGDPRNPEMQRVMNLKIKKRESFRPFAPSVLEEYATEYFEITTRSPYMLFTAAVQDKIRVSMNLNPSEASGLEKLTVARSTIPAVTHVDYSVRLQTVGPDWNPRYYQLLAAFRERTGCAVLINTSFNVRGEPIVCTPGDAFRCFMATEMDYLVIERFLLCKAEQPEPAARPLATEHEFDLD